MKTLRLLLLAVIFLSVGMVRTFAADAPMEDAATSAKLIAAIQAGDYAAFIADGETAFKQLPAPQFAALAAQLGPKLKAGHAVTYLGELQQRGYRVTLWRIRFSAGGDDLLARLSVKDGKIGGFFIQ